MQFSLLAFINLAAMLLGCSFLGHAIAQAGWRRNGTASVVLLIILCGQIWLLPQAISFLGFYSSRLLYPLWFGNWLILAFSAVVFTVVFRGTSRAGLDAARLDGMGILGIYRHVTWPRIRPVLGALAILLVMATWAEFARPLLPDSFPDESQITIPRTPQEIALTIAASFHATLPVIAIYLVACRYSPSGAALTATRG